MRTYLKVLATVLCLALIVGCTAAFAAPYSYGTVVATGGQSNLRTGPGLGYKSIGTFEKGESCVYLGQKQIDDRGIYWYYVDYDGTSCWVSSRYTTLTENSGFDWLDATDTYVRATARTNIRKGPGLKYDDIGTLVEGEQVLYLGTTVDDGAGGLWHKIENYSMGIGWVSSVYTELVEGTDSGVDDGWVPTTGTVVVATDGDSNLRSGPALTYKDIGTMKKGDKATYLNNSSTDERGVVWYNVIFNGVEGWVSSRYTTLTGGGIDPSFNQMYLRATARVNVRSGPGLEYDDIGTLVEGEQVKYLNKSQRATDGGLWYCIEFYSFGIGWVSEVYSELVYGGSIGIEDENTPVIGTYVEATKGNSNLHTGPGLDYTDVGTMKKGETATFLGSTSTDERGVVWYYVSYNGTYCWVSSRYTTLY